MARPLIGRGAGRHGREPLQQLPSRAESEQINGRRTPNPDADFGVSCVLANLDQDTYPGPPPVLSGYVSALRSQRRAIVYLLTTYDVFSRLSNRRVQEMVRAASIEFHSARDTFGETSATTDT